jgi:hypothetical protein
MTKNITECPKCNSTNIEINIKWIQKTELLCIDCLHSWMVYKNHKNIELEKNG